MKKPEDATFLIIGVGGLGAPLVMALAAAGAGRLVLVDDDVVELSNLQRQVLFGTADVGRPKVDAARDALRRHGVCRRRVEPVRARFAEDTARALLHDADVVCDGSDSLPTKFFTNDVATALGRPFVIGGVVETRGHVFPVRPGREACYRCLFEEPPAEELLTCSSAGVLGATCGEAAALMARAAWTLAGGADPEGVVGRMWILDGDARRSLVLRPRAGCPACSTIEQELTCPS